MIRSLAIVFLICGATLGGVHLASLSAGQAGAEGEMPAKYLGTPATVETELVAVNRISGGRNDGYFLARFVFAADAPAETEGPHPLELLLVDAFHQLVSAHDMFDLTDAVAIDVALLTKELRRITNRRAGREAVRALLVTQVDFLGPDEIRTNSAARRATIRGDATGAASSPAASRSRQ